MRNLGDWKGLHGDDRSILSSKPRDNPRDSREKRLSPPL